MHQRPLPRCAWLLLGLAACHGAPPLAAPPTRPAPSYEPVVGGPTGPALRLLFRPATHGTYAVRRRAGHPDTVLLTRYTGRWEAPPQVGGVWPAGNGHYLVQLNLAWFDMSQHWTDVAMLCLGDTAATELLYAEGLAKTRAADNPRGFRLTLEPLPAPAVATPADSARCWRVVLADSTATGLRERVRREVGCHCR